MEISFLRNVRLLLKDNKKKKCANASERKFEIVSERYFLCLTKCVAAPKSISRFFNERAAASEKILMTASERY